MVAPATGFAALLTVSGVLARAPGHGTSATLGLVALLLVAAAVASAPRRRRASGVQMGDV